MLSLSTHSLLINTIISRWNLTLMATEDKCTLPPPSLCFALHFLLAGPQSIIFESLWSTWKTTPAAAHPIEIKWSLCDSLSSDKLYVSSAQREKKIGFVLSWSACWCCATTKQQQHHLFIKKKWETIAKGGMRAPLTVKQLIKGKLCFPALLVPIQRSSYVRCQCQKAILITEKWGMREHYVFR